MVESCPGNRKKTIDTYVCSDIVNPYGIYKIILTSKLQTNK